MLFRLDIIVLGSFEYFKRLRKFSNF